MERDMRRRKTLEWILAACLSVLLLGTVWTVLGSYWETNDDRSIAEILSGAIGGVPEAHVVYINYILSCLLSFLYRVTAGIPWYGLTIILCHVLVYTALFRCAWEMGRALPERVLITGLMGGFVLVNLYITAALQYTSTAALMAVSGFVCLLLDREKRRGWIWFCFFEGAAFMLRDQAMLMIQPIAMPVCVSEFWREARKKSGQGKTEWIRKTACMLLTVCVIVLIGFLGTLAGYHGKEWSEFRQFNHARTMLFDYYGVSQYEDVKDILDRYSVSEKEYRAMCSHTFFGGRIGANCMEELAEYAKYTREERPSISEIVEGMIRLRSAEEYLQVGMVAGIACCLALGWFLLNGHFTALLSLAGLVAGRTAVEGYLIYRGRLPLRVVLPIFSCEIFLVTAVLVRDYVNGKRNARNYVSTGLVAAVLTVVFLSSGRQQYYAVKKEQGWQEAYIEGLVEVQEYCRAHPGKRYILDMESFLYYRGCVLESRLAGWQNGVYSGGWFFKTPVMEEWIHQYLEDEKSNICLVVYEDGLGEDKYVVAYLAEVLGEELVILDRLEVSNGAAYLVWGIKSD